MGRGIAELAARSGLAVSLHDAIPGAAAKAIATIGEALQRDAEKGRLTHDQAATIQAAVREGSLDTVAASDLVIEAIVENLDAKRALFREIAATARRDAILATNTSSLSVAAIAEAVPDPSRFAGLHFFNPPTRMRIVEIVRAPGTAPATVAKLEVVAARLGQRAFIVGDTPGFLVNHIGRGYSGEALRMLDEGIAPPQTLDRIARGALHFRMGPFELLDLTGIDITAAVTEQVWRGFGEEPRFRLAPIAKARVAAGLLGRKSSRGFYQYDASGKPLTLPELPPDAAPAKLRLAGVPDDLRETLGALLPSGLATDDLSAAAVVLPIGTSVTAKAEHLDLDPKRAVGIDPLFTGLVTLAPTDRTDPALLAAAAASYAAGGREVAIVRDGPGMPAQRIATMMVLIACDAVARGIGTPADIDDAAKRALGYPLGPLELGDAVGPLRVTEIAAGLFDLTGDPRWRPSHWLIERVRTGRRLADASQN